MTELRTQFVWGFLIGSLFAVALGAVSSMLSLALPLNQPINWAFINLPFAVIGFPAGVLIGVVVSGRVLQEQGSTLGTFIGILLAAGTATLVSVLLNISSMLLFSMCLLCPLLGTTGYYLAYFFSDE